MNPVSVDIKDMVESESSLGLIFATDLFIGQEPSEPDDVVTIFDTGGMPSQLTFAKGEDYHNPSIQVRVRSNDYETGWTLLNDIKTFLHGKGPEVQGGTTYTMIRCMNGPVMLGWDKSRRVRFVANFNIQRR